MCSVCEKLIRSIDKYSVTLTPCLVDIPYVLMKHESKSQLDAKLKQIEKEGKDVSEASITKYFEHLDSPAIQAFIQHPTSTDNE